ncbi:hypothetical protein [Aquimarina sp. 2201CG14-23]|uniref:hypothetical protein n=1 Tax=Aquimarina mycalae TaxID=3040073 RepID=UPI002477E2BA|nr:hypothetical protein [Aquimarina sp. 2201CG14-23]MDH7445723.1 hypothetical protein [Aquimarina sp. 2201CG14-23]
MNRQFFVNKVTIICTMFFMVGCSTDPVTNDVVANEVTIEKNRSLIEDDKTIEILIVYAKGTDERTKERIRQQYIDIRLLLNVEQCEFEDVETWIFDLIKYNKGKPKRNPQSDNEPVTKAYFDNNCEDYKGN